MPTSGKGFSQIPFLPFSLARIHAHIPHARRVTEVHFRPYLCIVPPISLTLLIYIYLRYLLLYKSGVYLLVSGFTYSILLHEFSGPDKT